MAERYDDIGATYDATRRADPRIVDRLRRHLALAPGARCLDLACGTGNYTLALIDAGLRVAGVDVSGTMLARARAKRPDGDWHQAPAEELPFADAAFDGAVCTLAIHHFRDRRAAFREVRRVLGGGRFVILTGTREQMARYWLNHYFPGPMRRSMDVMPSASAIETELRDAGFARVTTEPFDVPEDCVDLFLYAGKHRPGLYLDARVRAGISTFAAFAEPGEVARGLKALIRDIGSNAVARVAARYDSPHGDYLFVVAET